MNSSKLRAPFCRLLVACGLAFGFTGTSHAISCETFNPDPGMPTWVGDTFDVTVEGMPANSCGTGSTLNDTVGQPPSSWQVNVDNAGGMSDWAYYEREEEITPESPDGHDGSTDLIGLETEFQIGEGTTSGNFTIANAFDPFLIVMKTDASNYQWYMFEGKSGSLAGFFDASTVFGGQDLSHLSIYTKVVPIPAAVWLFGSGLLGLVGIARRRRS